MAAVDCHGLDGIGDCGDGVVESIQDLGAWINGSVSYYATAGSLRVLSII